MLVIIDAVTMSHHVDDGGDGDDGADGGGSEGGYDDIVDDRGSNGRSSSNEL